MTLNLAALTTIYVNRTMPEYDDYSFSLVSQYSNKDITEDFTISFVDKNNYGDWSRVRFVVQSLDENSDYNGYYTLKVLGITNSLKTPIETTLCKVKYVKDENIEYVSDNENNEQYVYYRK